MESYIFNVALSFGPYVALALIAFGIGRIISKHTKVDQQVARRRGNLAAGYILLFGIAVALFSPANTPKNQLHMPDRAYTVDPNKAAADIVDRTRQPTKSAEERQATVNELIRR